MNERNFSAVPEAACRLAGGEVIFRDNGPNSKSAGIRLKARSGEPIAHWYWGNVVHDLSGVRHKPRIAVDYAHNESEVLGYVNHFDTETNDLWLTGAMTPWREDDRASEVMFKMREGVPYEASIFFGGDGIKVQEIAEGQIEQVNGRQFEGPGIIIREWPLRGVAICPYGADQNTESAAMSSGKTFAAEIVATEHKEHEMNTETAAVEVEAVVEAPAAVETPAVETEAVETPVPEVATEQAQEAAPEAQPLSREEFTKIADEFGADVAVQTVRDGGDYSTALRLAFDASKAEVKTLRGRVAELEAKTKSGGQAVPVTDAKPKSGLFKTGK